MIPMNLFLWDVPAKRNYNAGDPEGIEMRRSVSTVTRKMQNSTAGLMTP